MGRGVATRRAPVSAEEGGEGGGQRGRADVSGQRCAGLPRGEASLPAVQARVLLGPRGPWDGRDPAPAAEPPPCVQEGGPRRPLAGAGTLRAVSIMSAAWCDLRIREKSSISAEAEAASEKRHPSGMLGKEKTFWKQGTS